MKNFGLILIIFTGVLISLIGASFEKEDVEQSSVVNEELNFTAEYITEISRSASNWWGVGVQYGRIIQLQQENSGRLLAIFEALNAGLMAQTPAYPVYSSDDLGKTWKKIVYRTTSNGMLWSGSAVDIVALDNRTLRPGMPVVTRLGDESYFMVYEVGNEAGNNGNPIYYKVSSDGLNWENVSSIGTKIETGGKALGSSPYTGWTPVGSDNGTLIVSGMFMGSGSSTTGSDYFISYDYGKTWTTKPHPIPYKEGGYSNSFSFSTDGK